MEVIDLVGIRLEVVGWDKVVFCMNDARLRVMDLDVLCCQVGRVEVGLVLSVVGSGLFGEI